EQNGSSKCLPCKEDEYIEYPNDFTKCLGCRTCREDQVELSPCRAVSDTQCACRNGTFCSPDHPCEMCQKCRPRCPENEMELAPCTPHSDRQCGPPTGTFSDSSSKYMSVPLCSVVLGRGLMLSSAFTKLISLGELPGLDHGFCMEMARGLLPLFWVQDCKICLLQSAARVLCKFNADAEQTDSSSLPVMVPRTSHPNVKPRRNLVPVQGKDPVTLLRRSFDIFARDVPCKDWKRFGRALDLLENDIALAEMNDKYSLEPFFQMLNTWQNREGMNASVNTLLETLHQINLGGIAEDISSKLVQQGSFQYEVS
ncbi:Tumor necrosis factor receptor superfamily member 10B, partial [Spheniscus mendiculus]